MQCSEEGILDHAGDNSLIEKLISLLISDSETRVKVEMFLGYGGGG